MGGYRLAAQDAVVVQAFDHSHSMLAVALVHIGLCLRNVNMKTCTEFLCKQSATGHGLVAHGKGGVQPEEPPEQGVLGLLAVREECPVFRDALIRNFRAVAIHDLIAETTAHTGLARGLCDTEEAAGYRAGTGVVIEDGGGAVLDAV